MRPPRLSRKRTWVHLARGHLATKRTWNSDRSSFVPTILKEGKLLNEFPGRKVSA